VFLEQPDEQWAIWWMDMLKSKKVYSPLLINVFLRLGSKNKNNTTIIKVQKKFNETLKNNAYIMDYLIENEKFDAIYNSTEQGVILLNHILKTKSLVWIKEHLNNLLLLRIWGEYPSIDSNIDFYYTDEWAKVWLNNKSEIFSLLKKKLYIKNEDVKKNTSLKNIIDFSGLIRWAYESFSEEPRNSIDTFWIEDLLSSNAEDSRINQSINIKAIRSIILKQKMSSALNNAGKYSKVKVRI